MGLTQWLALSVLVFGAHADINTRFRVENGQGAVTRNGNTSTYGGSCYSNSADLAAIYAEATDMAQVTVTALGTYSSNPTVRATVETFWGIKPDGTSVSTAHQAYFSYVLGEMTGETLSSRTAGQVTELYWSPLYQTYAGAGIGCKPDTYGFTMYSPLTITMCPLSWNDAKRKDSLSDWRTGVKTIADGTALKAALSVPSTVLHELCHMTTTGVITDKKVTYRGTVYDAYGPTLGAALALASPNDAVHNADNYRWFATAMYLDGYDWSRTLASGAPAANAKRANISSSDILETGIPKRKSISERRQIDWLVEDETDDWAQFN
ncbi:hypothetical protein SUNI508_13338 [Seiridium unicorne]|uniref:Lysine-specific metallo-endopeptidase domain-containing protein n=1 Tax=Seiridium unicorne TaxID=138068 RepID=A0ABR2VD81_9PEZI